MPTVLVTEVFMGGGAALPTNSIKSSAGKCKTNYVGHPSNDITGENKCM